MLHCFALCLPLSATVLLSFVPYMQYKYLTPLPLSTFLKSYKQNSKYLAVSLP